LIKRGSDGIGSDDFGELLGGLDNSRDYKQAKGFGNDIEAAVNHMEQTVEHRVLQFLLARFCLLKLLVDEAKNGGGLHPANHRLLWVLLQAIPIEMFGADVFRDLAKELRTASTEDLRQQIRDKCEELNPILESVNGRRRPFYCFVDEIQMTTKSRLCEFWSDDKQTKRPLLRPIWSSLTGILHPSEMLVILSGTGIDWKSLQEVLESNIFKIYPFTFKTNTGAFDDPDAQKLYIERYLPVEHSVTRDAFLERAWGWCRGRYFSQSSRGIDSKLPLFSQVPQYRSPCPTYSCGRLALSSQDA
jgi:hypothetical protein